MRDKWDIVNLNARTVKQRAGICCEKQGGCDNRCDMMDSYEYAEECEGYVVEDDFEV